MGLAGQGAVEEVPQHDHHHGGHAKYPQTLGHQGGAEDFDRGVAGEGRQAVRALAQEDGGEAANDQRSADGDDDQGDGFGTLHRLDGQLFNHDADDGRNQDGQHQGCRQGQAGLGEEHCQHAAQHDEFALGEVDHVAGVVNEREAEGRKGVGGADGGAREEELEELASITHPLLADGFVSR
jgi:hypothetical protein